MNTWRPQLVNSSGSGVQSPLNAHTVLFLGANITVLCFFEPNKKCPKRNSWLNLAKMYFTVQPLPMLVVRIVSFSFTTQLLFLLLWAFYLSKSIFFFSLGTVHFIWEIMPDALAHFMCIIPNFLLQVFLLCLNSCQHFQSVFWKNGISNFANNKQCLLLLKKSVSNAENI